MLESAQLYSYIQILTINIMEHFYNCISSVFTKLAEKPLQSMFSLILLLIFAQSSHSTGDIGVYTRTHKKLHGIYYISWVIACQRSL